LHSARPARNNEGVPLDVLELNTDEEISAAFPAWIDVGDLLEGR
jgi:hypothetical protein